MNLFQQNIEVKISNLHKEEALAKEVVCEKILNVFGYPNNVELYTFHKNNATHFVDVVNGITLATVEVKNDEISFWVETNYYGDWWK